MLISSRRGGSRRLTWRACKRSVNVHVLLHQGGYGDFSHLDRYLAAVDWLDANGIEYGWLENLTGQDYPLRPIAEIEDALDGDATTTVPAVQPGVPASACPPDADQGAARYRLGHAVRREMRYDYRHWRLGKADDGQAAA